MTQRMTTVCTGRFLVELPEEARLELARPRVDGFDISSFDEPDADFRMRLVQREARLRAAPDRLGGNKNVESVREAKTDNGVAGKIVVHSPTVREGTRPRGLERARYRFEHVAVEALVHGQGMGFDLSAEKYGPDQVDSLVRLVAITGDELVRRVAEMNDTVDYPFWWEVDGTQDNVFVPRFVFKMTTGESNEGPVPSSLSHAAALALRDKTSSSIHFHSPDPRKLSHPAPRPPKA